jgi:EAL domain-containing protein (putative c-di-GMP-specific phosphodiesterase class I)/GGDEF domain-containing protein
MTLFRQIAILISLVFIVLLTVITVNNFRQSSSFLQGQLQSTANDMATTLGVTIATAVNDDDIAAIDTLFNTVFDSGYYASIELKATGGKHIASREQPIVINAVPAWFVEIIDFPVVMGKTKVSRGWFPYGDLELKLHPGYAYAQLYNALQSMMLWFGIVVFAGLGSLWGMLRYTLKPLMAVKQQADAIQENRFIQQETLPRTIELRQVVTAMNRMVEKVKTVFDSQSETLNQYHEVLYRDPLTKLGNRSFFIMRLSEICDSELSSSGWLVLINVHQLAVLGEKQGHQIMEKVVITVADAMCNLSSKESAETCSRMKSNEFMIYLFEELETARAYMDKVFSQFKTIFENEPGCENLWLYGALTEVEANAKIGDVLSDVDYAIAQANAMGPYAIYQARQHVSTLPQGKMQWRKWIEESLSQHRFFVVSQKVQRTDETLFHQELFVRLRDSFGNTVPAGSFMPMACALGLEFEIDKAVFLLANEVSRKNTEEPIALNLSSSVLTNVDALTEFEMFLKTYTQGTHAPLHVEIAHFVLLQHSDITEHIADMLRRYHCKVGIDRLDLGRSLLPLQVIRPDYVKIGIWQLDDITNDRINSAFQALKTLVVGMDIEMLAVGVESEQSYLKLKELGISAMQGEYLGMPQEVGS